MNPLDHYHQIGWQEGRDPSGDFDTTLYLINNPDVAAAGIDPLEHYLAVRHRRGPLGLRGDRAEHRRRLRCRVLPVPQSRRGGGRRRSAAPLQRGRLARGARSERLVRHRRLSLALHRRRGRGHQSAAALRDGRLDRRPRSVGRLRHARLSGGQSGRRGGAASTRSTTSCSSASTRAAQRWATACGTEDQNGRGVRAPSR